MSSQSSPAPGFLDAVSGQPMPPSVLESYAQSAAATWADPVRLHHLGRQSRLFLTTARASLAGHLSEATGVQLSAEQIYFATAIQPAATWAARGFLGVEQFAASQIETLAMVDGIVEHEPKVQLLTVDQFGCLDASALDLLAAPASTVLALQAANVEIGTVQDRAAPAGRGFRLIVDASQCLGRIDLDAHWSVLVLPASDWGGPTGLVIMAVHPQARWSPPNDTVGGWPGGGVNVPAAVAAASALALAMPSLGTESNAQFGMIEGLRSAIAAAISDVVFAGHSSRRLPHILNCSVLYVSGEALVMELDRRGFAVASGSACVADSDRASHVLVAVGGFTGGNLRISLPFGCTQKTLDSFLVALIEVVGELREGSGL